MFNRAGQARVKMMCRFNGRGSTPPQLPYASQLPREEAEQLLHRHPATQTATLTCVGPCQVNGEALQPLRLC